MCVALRNPSVFTLIPMAFLHALMGLFASPVMNHVPVLCAVSVMQHETLAQLHDMASWKTSRLMSFDAVSSHIRCHFNELLVDLMRDVRQLQGLGFRMRPELTAEVEVAARFHRCVMCVTE